MNHLIDIGKQPEYALSAPHNMRVLLNGEEFTFKRHILPVTFTDEWDRESLTKIGTCYLVATASIDADRNRYMRLDEVVHHGFMDDKKRALMTRIEMWQALVKGEFEVN